MNSTGSHAKSHPSESQSTELQVNFSSVRNERGAEAWGVLNNNKMSKLWWCGHGKDNCTDGSS